MASKTQTWVDGKRARIIPRCARCGFVLDDGEPLKHGWQWEKLDVYYDISGCPHYGIWGWLCPKCSKGS